jgi:uncharacterized protein
LESRRVKRFLTSEVGAAVLWVVMSLLLAAVLAPWLHQGGKWLAGVARARELPGLIEWLASACGRAGFDRFFDRALLLSALLTLPLLLRRIRKLRRQDGPVAVVGNGSLGGWPAPLQLVAGCVLAGGLLWSLCLFIAWTGALADKPASPTFGRFASKALLPALGASVVEEWLFRGVLLGLWLRFTGPFAACAGSAVIFAFLHFLKPPDGTVIADPSHPLAGFELLGCVLHNYADPRFFITDFASLAAVGMILAWARLRTGALWFPIGLHAGWIMAFKSCGLFYRKVEDHPLSPWGVGDSLRSGLLPLLTLTVTAGVCHFVMKRINRASP